MTVPRRVSIKYIFTEKYGIVSYMQVSQVAPLETYPLT